MCGETHDVIRRPPAVRGGQTSSIAMWPPALLVVEVLIHSESPVRLCVSVYGNEIRFSGHFHTPIPRFLS